MKKSIAAACAVLFFALTLSVFTACATQTQYDVVCTIFPQYDFCKRIVGEEGVSVKMLLPYGTDAHNYELKLGDKKAIRSAKLFVCVGGESERWIKDVEKSTDLSGVKTIRWMDECTPIPLAEDHAHEHEDHDGYDYDEHVYLSVKNCVNFCMKLCSELSVLYPDHSAAFAENAEKLVDELTEMDEGYTQAAQDARVKTLYFADRFPFAYLCRDYGFSYKTPYKGCSADVEISAGDKTAFEKAYKASGASGVIVIENGNDALAKSVLAGTDGKIYVLHSCQTVTKEEDRAGKGYVDFMKNNLRVIREATR